MPINLEIVSPEKLLLSRDVDMVVVPAAEGDMGVLEGHAPMTVALRGGVVSLYEGDKVIDSLFVASGFAEVTPERCTVLAGEALPVNEIDREEAEKRIRDSEAAMAQAESENVAEQEMALERVQSARAMMDAIDGLLTGH
jgi:F-type H+-transporting ATPase subunit epsilon